MVKGEDVKLRKKNKAIRKKLAKDPSAVSGRVAALIAAKKRRHTGKRRNCQGMCFSLPTPEDPFNERHGKEEISKSKSKRLPPQVKDKASRSKRLELENLDKIPADNSKLAKCEKLVTNEKDRYHCTLRNFGCPSKFLWSCLSSVQETLRGNGIMKLEHDRPSVFDSWGFEFWKAYSSWNDILENSGRSPSVRQMTWIASTATDSLSQKEKEGMSITSPFLLYLVPSQEKANEVRSVFKCLKAFGIHTVSVHPGTTVEHQAEGLEKTKPEFIIATPERLKELVLLKAVDISRASFLVVDAIDSLSDSLDAVKWIKNSINKDSCTMAFQGDADGSYVKAAESILKTSFVNLTLEDDLRNSPGI